jgi:hypothetical protein
MSAEFKVEDIIRNGVPPESRDLMYAFLKVKFGMTGMDMEKTTMALNILAAEGWRVILFQPAGTSTGYILRKITSGYT